MPVAFVDANGGKGWIDDDLSVRHFGRATITESIEALIAELDADADTPDDVLHRLVIELPQACAIRDIARVDGDGEHD